MKTYFFKGNSFENMIKLIAEVLGTDDLLTYLKKYKMPVKELIIDNMDYFDKKDLRSFITNEN